MHLAQAEEILCGNDLSPTASHLLTQQRGPFLLGNTAPDVQTISGQARIETHFYTLPRVSTRPAYEELFVAHPALAHAGELEPAQAAFIAGYIVHLLLDELWLDEIFLRYFCGDDTTRQEQAFLHNILRTWMDTQDQARLNGNVTTPLQEAIPQDWLPFIQDADLHIWRNWLVEQLGPGRNTQTAEVFARRMGISAQEMKAILQSPEQMKQRIFQRVSLDTLQAFREEGYRQSVVLINRYIGTLVDW
jgi:hypothetical protein